MNYEIKYKSSMKNEIIKLDRKFNKKNIQDEKDINAIVYIIFSFILIFVVCILTYIYL